MAGVFNSLCSFLGGRQKDDLLSHPYTRLKAVNDGDSDTLCNMTLQGHTHTRACIMVLNVTLS